MHKKSVIKSVIITRPLAQAGEFARRVEAIGRRPEIFPLLEIHALADNSALETVLSRLSEFALVAFVSPNAIDAVFRHIHEWPEQGPIAVRGAGSRAALAAHGVTATRYHIISPSNRDRTDSETLLDDLDLEQLSGKQVLIVRGQTGRELLGDALRARAIHVTQIAAYRRDAPELSEQVRKKVSKLLEQDNDWVVTSTEALKTMLSWANRVDISDGVAKMQRQHIIVPHVRIAENAKLFGFQTITLTGSGDERLLVALQSQL
jgi:uroporphyrinogen-III synthase